MSSALPFGPPVPLGSYDPAAFNPALAREAACNAAREVFLGMGRLPMGALIFAQKTPSWEDNVPPYSLYVQVLKEVSEESKETFARMLPLTLDALEAVSVTILTEAWTVMSRVPGVMEDVMRWREKHGTIMGHPATGEILWVSFETSSVQELWFAPIFRPESGARLGCFEQMPPGARIEGRFAAMLRPLNVKVEA